MITEQDLNAAIAECQGKRDPKSSDCIKLAAFYIIKNELYGKPEQSPASAYSYLPPPVETVENHTVDYISDTEFSQAVHGQDSGDMWAIMDELMTTLAVLYPRLYDSVLRKIRE